MPRYYIENSSIFDSPPYYQAKKIAKIVKETGIAHNIRLANYRGWSNQPKVVCFDAAHQPSADVIAIHVGAVLGRRHSRFRKWGVFARKKDW